MNRNNIPKFTLLAPKELDITEITDDHYKILDRDGAIALAKTFHKLLMSSPDNTQAHDDEPETLETVSETHDMTEDIKDAQLVTDSHKKPYHAYRWSSSDRVALYTAAEKGMPLSTIFENWKSTGRPFTKKAYQKQLNSMGWSFKHGADNPMVKMPDHNSRWLVYQEKHKMNETHDDDK